jgi:hypothetical protein
MEVSKKAARASISPSLASSKFSPFTSSGSMITHGGMWLRPARHSGNVALISRMLYMWYKRSSATLNLSRTYSR